MLTPVSSSVSATSDIFQPQKIFFLSFCIFVFLLTFLFEIKVLKGHILPGFESEIIAEVFPRKEEKEKSSQQQDWELFSLCRNLGQIQTDTNELNFGTK